MARTSRYVDEIDPVILSSARKHGVADADMLHAYHHPVRVFALDNLTMLIGAGSSGRILEVGVAKPKVSTSSFTPCQPDPSS